MRFKPQADSVRAKALSVRATRGEAREVAQTRATALGLRTGRALAAGISLDERTHVVTAKGVTSEQLMRQLAADSEVELAVVVEVVLTTAEQEHQQHLQSQDQQTQVAAEEEVMMEFIELAVLVVKVL